MIIFDTKNNFYSNHNNNSLSIPQPKTLYSARAITTATITENFKKLSQKQRTQSLSRHNRKFLKQLDFKLKQQ